MWQALDQAKSCGNFCAPNPRVGCVLVSPQGQMLGAGHTQKVGEAHAEIMALRDAKQRGNSVRGATAYVTLEPCSHHGRTGPCCEALSAAGIAKVIAAIADPNPLVAGRGFDRLRAAGIAVEVGLGAHEARELNIGFFSRMIRKKPWVRMKIAASLDGRTALENGASQWITSESARTDGHVWRARACAVLTGIGTILKDNPRLDVRLMNSSRQPQLVVVDSNLATPLDAHIFMADRALYIYTAVENDLKKAALEKRGATVVYLPGEDGQVNLSGMLLDLGRREINELHVEAGQRLNGSLFDLDLVDEMVVYLAPKLIGQGYGIANIAPLIDLSQAISLEFMSIANVGPDLQVITRVLGHNEF